MILLISLGASAATYLGGLIALRFKDRLHLILGFSAGAVIGVAFFDLMPEALGLTSQYFTTPTTLSIVALGFISYMILDRSIALHSHTDEDSCNKHRSNIGAGSLSIHSFLDGVAIGVAFQVGTAVGTIVAVAVLVHDFSDGMNTVNMILKNNGDRMRALKWLSIDAIAPILGVISTLFFTLEESVLGIILALFSGFFLYIGASDLLPESHHGHSTMWTTVATVVGTSILFVAIKLAGI
ncbi:MAG: ZIP family metal transporter [Patescibacteria group bacterium]